jgi:hypothetical protein
VVVVVVVVVGSIGGGSIVVVVVVVVLVVVVVIVVIVVIDATTAAATQTAATDMKDNDMSPRANSRKKTATPKKPLFTYECLHCHIQVTNRVATRQIDVPRQHCGMRFSIHDRQVVRRFLHATGAELQVCGPNKNST